MSCTVLYCKLARLGGQFRVDCLTSHWQLVKCVYHLLNWQQHNKSRLFATPVKCSRAMIYRRLSTGLLLYFHVDHLVCDMICIIQPYVTIHVYPAICHVYPARKGRTQDSAPWKKKNQNAVQLWGFSGHKQMQMLGHYFLTFWVWATQKLVPSVYAAKIAVTEWLKV